MTKPGAKMGVVHPTRGDALTPLERQLWRLRMVAQEAGALLRGLNQTALAGVELPGGLWLSLTNHALLITTKFLEVWEAFGTLGRDTPRVIEVRRALKPIIRRLEVWPGLRDFRNTAVAHAYEAGDGRLVGPWDAMTRGAAPTYHAEAVFLLSCALHVCAFALAAFPEDYAGLAGSFRSDEPVPDSGPGLMYDGEVGPALHTLLDAVAPDLASVGIPSDSPVYVELRVTTAAGETAAGTTGPGVPPPHTT